MPVSFGINGNRANPHLPDGTHDPQCDLTPVRNQNLIDEHWQSAINN
jgi:hypothetical protein